MRLLIALAVVVAVYVIQFKLYHKYWNMGLNVRIDFSGKAVSVGDELDLVEVVENDKSLPLPIINIKFATSRTFKFAEEENANVSDHYYRNDVFSILGNQRITRRLSFKTTARGTFRINELQATSKDLFLRHTFAHIYSNDTTVMVMPKRIPMKDFPSMRMKLMGDNMIDRVDPPDPYAFRGIRPYQSYDTMRSINWKASAHMNELMVNQYQATTDNEMRIYLNLTPYMKSNADRLAEHSISIVSTLAADCMSHGIRVGFVTNGYDIDSEAEGTSQVSVADKDIITDGNIDEDNLYKRDTHPVLEPGYGREHMRSLDIMLARIDLKKKASDFLEVVRTGFVEDERCVTHVIISTYRDDALYGFFGEHCKRDNMIWIIPELPAANVDIRYEGMYRWDQ